MQDYEYLKVCNEASPVLFYGEDDRGFGDFSENRPEEAAEVIEYARYWIAPGLVDTHIYGFRNHDIMDNDFEGLNQISVGLLIFIV